MSSDEHAMMTELQNEVSRLKVAAAFFEEQATRYQLQLSAVSIAAKGLPGVAELEPGAYAYSTVLADVLRLRQELDRLRLVIGDCEDLPQVVASLQAA